MPETIDGQIYDFPQYYDLVYGSDWKAEFDFLQACFHKHGSRPIRRLFEPACGTGRLMIKLAEAGYEVAGNDLNPHAVKFCNARLRRKGFSECATVGDMSDFRLPRKVDACFNMINSFRHLQTEQAAEAHLRCVADCLVKNGLYILGLHLTPTEGERVEDESWAARRGNLAVVSSMWSLDLDRRKRKEHLLMHFDVYTPTKQFRIAEEMDYRTYTARQMHNLLEKVPELQAVALYDFAYEIDHPVEIDAGTEDVVYVLKKK